MFENNDDYDFSPSTSSKLSSLFETPMFPEDLSSSLTYTAPKQPRPKKNLDLDDSLKSKPQSSVILAKVVNLWKLNSINQKEHIGKHGLAVIGSIVQDIFEIIIYKEKNNIIVRVRVNENFIWYVYADHFGAFYDLEQRFWMVKFEKEGDENHFLNELQKYKCKIIKNAQNTENKNEIVKEKIKVDKEQDSDGSGAQTKANILSRITKMGQQILPERLSKNTSTDFSDSESEESKSGKPNIAPRKFKRNYTMPKSESLQKPPEKNILTSQMSDSSGQMTSMQIATSFQNQLVTSNFQNPTLYSQANPCDGFNNFIIAQNVELKANLAQINAKLDAALTGNSQNNVKSETEKVLISKVKCFGLKIDNLTSDLEENQRKYNDLCKEYYEMKKNECKENEKDMLIQKQKEQIEILKRELESKEENSAKIRELESQIEAYKKQLKEQENITEIQILKLKDFEEFYEQNKNVKDTVNTLNETVESLNLKLKNLEEVHNKTLAEIEEKSRTEEPNLHSFNESIKKHMNNMYQELISNFNENRNYSVKEINENVTVNLKATTYKIIEDFKKQHN